MEYIARINLRRVDQSIVCDVNSSTILGTNKQGRMDGKPDGLLRGSVVRH